MVGTKNVRGARAEGRVERRRAVARAGAAGTRLRDRGESEAEIVVAGADAEVQGDEPRLIGPEDILVEERGAGQTLRYVHHLLPPSAEAQRLILVEVYTPAGNWSSFPPHKHDTDDPPRESYLEEIYYFRIQPETGFALQRIYTADEDLDVTLAPVRRGPGAGAARLPRGGQHPGHTSATT